MKQMTPMKMALAIMTGCLALQALSGPTISDVLVRQRWPWSRLVDIEYVLACDSTQRVDIVVEAYDGDRPLSLPLKSLSGDLYNVANGLNCIVWDPMKTDFSNEIIPRFAVELNPIEPPLYMIVDLTKTPDAPGQIEYVYWQELMAGQWGGWAQNMITNDGDVVESRIWTGVTTNDIYKTEKMVFRRIPAGSFGMGPDCDIPVVLTRGFYAGVFEVTEAQLALIQGAGASTMKAAGYTSYYQLRENSDNSNDPLVDWPSNTTVNANSVIGKVRTMTGLEGVDLPTEAQWEYFCRAGTTTYYNDGNASAPNDGISLDPAVSNTFMNAVGWYAHNTGKTKQIVGLKNPNAWGIYDTHGNVWEWCLDYEQKDVPGGVDPVGPASNADNRRVWRGGGYMDGAGFCRSSSRGGYFAHYLQAPRGFRFIVRLP